MVFLGASLSYFYAKMCNVPSALSFVFLCYLISQPSEGAQNYQHQHQHHSYGYRGRGRGRGIGGPRPVTKLHYDFDFMAMNEKFNKDEVWGHLGKTKSHSKEKDGEDVSNEDDGQDGYNGEESKNEVKPVYNKDDFFDTLSCNSLDHYPQNGRTRYSEQVKIDTETFGDFVRPRGGRGAVACYVVVAVALGVVIMGSG
ncbi:hypothetical protein K1719_023242 [Acacia pycnantha]|nr:hypothetical protein K1719_023242 [Acacia pycnantha]